MGHNINYTVRVGQVLIHSHSVYMGHNINYSPVLNLLL